MNFGMRKLDATMTNATKLKLVCLVLAFLFIPRTSTAQLTGCANIELGPNVSVDCNDPCVTLEAEVVEVGSTTQYDVMSLPYAPPFPFNQGTDIFIGEDDTWSNVIPLPFDFCFFGETHNSIIVGANGVLTFDLSLAEQYCDWQFSQSIPNSTGVPYRSSINGAYHDIDPSVAGNIRYAILGDYPCRTFVVSFDNIPHYQCNSEITTQQIVLYETTNIIDVYVEDKPICGSWNGGNALIGIQNAGGTTAYVPPARNTGPWTASNEAWRFSPSGGAAFEVEWFDGSGSSIGVGESIEVCPTATEIFTAQVTYDICDGTWVVATDQIEVAMVGEVTTSLTTEVTCGSYSWNNVTYNSTGIYTYTTTNSIGCDSIATLDLTVNLATYSIGTAVACETYTWNGETYNETGSYQFITTGASGCDSVSTLDLTIVEPSYSFQFVESCEPYLWNGELYDVSGEYTFNTLNAVGCDSVATLSLNVNSPTESIEAIESCDPYLWNGVLYDVSGQYTYSTTNTNGCDSTATLNLSILTFTTSLTQESSCAPVLWNGVMYESSGLYSYTTVNSQGCDSIASLDLTISSPSSSYELVNSCESVTWNGVDYSASGIYEYTTINSAGCDSIATLDLVVNFPSESFSTVETCMPYLWNGEIYDVSGVYTYATTNASGCDSLATLDLSVQSYTSSLSEQSSCGPVVWNGSVYETSGSYTYTTQNSQGCDSIAILDLTVGSTSSSYNFVNSCDVVTWNGEDYTASGNYEFFTINSAGCDSIAYLEVQINEPTASLEIVDACEEFVWNGEVYNESGVYSYSTFNSVGCDSIATLDLMIYGASPTNVVVEKEACNEFTWNETTYTESGEYSFVTNNEFGCDSTITLNLIIYSDRLFIPNSFTPDNDGVNDVFFPVGEDVDLKTLEIFNRWGELVYQSESLDSKWNGTTSDGFYFCPDGVYTYHVVYKCLATTYEKFGHVNLFR